MGAPRLKVGLDTSCLVPLFAEEHDDHAVTRAEWERLRRGNVQFVVACHALLECFSVLTRMPPPYRRSPEEVKRLLRENFGQDALIPGLDSELAWISIAEVVASGRSGGDIYDAIIARSVFGAGAGVLLTWNLQDFLPLAPPGLDVVTPAEYATRGSRVH